MKDFKGNTELNNKLTQLIQTLKASDKAKNKPEAFYTNLTDIRDYIDAINYQLNRYLKANWFKKKSIGSNVRHKLMSLKYQLVFSNRMLDMCYVSPVAKLEIPHAPA